MLKLFPSHMNIDLNKRTKILIKSLSRVASLKFIKRKVPSKNTKQKNKIYEANDIQSTKIMIIRKIQSELHFSDIDNSFHELFSLCSDAKSCHSVFP